jgi:O-acetyl-ADP-ribose deacetylase (regulator of RNase III)
MVEQQNYFNNKSKVKYIMTSIETVQGNITEYPADIIVNAANKSLLGGGGVDGAIHKAAGIELLEACRKLNGAETGEAKITDAFNIITATKIIHTVGPVYGWDPENAPIKLAQCYINSLNLATDFTTIVFPAISTGVFGYPKEEAAKVAVTTISTWLAEHPETSLKTITLIAFDDEDLIILEQAINNFS